MRNKRRQLGWLKLRSLEEGGCRAETQTFEDGAGQCSAERAGVPEGVLRRLMLQMLAKLHAEISYSSWNKLILMKQETHSLPSPSFAVSLQCSSGAISNWEQMTKQMWNLQFQAQYHKTQKKKVVVAVAER